MARNCTSTDPYLRQLVADLGTTGWGLVLSTAVATLIVLVLTIATVSRIHRHTRNAQERFLSYCLVGICPVVGTTAYTGIISPRSVHIDDLVAAIYLSLNVVVYFRLLMLHHGGEKALCKKMNGLILPLAHRPFCCCICLRNIFVSRHTLKRLKFAVYQVVVARPVLLYISAVFKSEEENPSDSLGSHPAKTVLSVLTMTSTFTAIIALMGVFRLSLEPLHAHGVEPKFVHLKLVMLLCDVQSLIIGLVVTAGGLPCGDLFYHPARADTLKFVLLCFEMVFLSFLAYRQYGNPSLAQAHEADQLSMEKGDKSVNDRAISNEDKAKTKAEEANEFSASTKL